MTLVSPAPVIPYPPWSRSMLSPLGPARASSYVILAHGKLTEEHLAGPHQCASEEFTSGAAFVEGPGQVHSVKNTGSNVAVIWWATVFPQSDGIVDFAPGFKAGGVYVVPAPDCD